MELQVGKFYKSREGKKCFVFYISKRSIFPVQYVEIGTGGSYNCNLNGTSLNKEESPSDLIEEWK